MHNVHNPSVPGAIPIYEPMVAGSKIDVHGHVLHGHHKNFAVELLSGPHIVLHINFRFHHEHTVVMNSFSHGCWASEVRHHNPLHHGDHFHLHIHAHHDHYDIEVNGHHLARFPHRHALGSVQALGLKGDVHVKEVKFHGFHFRSTWGAHVDFGHQGYNAYGTEVYVAPQFQGGHGHGQYW